MLPRLRRVSECLPQQPAHSLPAILHRSGNPSPLRHPATESPRQQELEPPDASLPRPGHGRHPSHRRLGMGNHPSAKLRPPRSSSGRTRLDRAGVLADPGPVRAELGDGVAVAVYRLVLPGRLDELADQVG